MFSLLLDEIEAKWPVSTRSVSADQYFELIDIVHPLLESAVEPLIGATKALLGENVFATSQIGCQDQAVRLDKNPSAQITNQIAAMRIVPDFTKPAVSFGFNVYHGSEAIRYPDPTCIDIEFEVEEFEAKEAFTVLFTDYRAQVVRLLEYGNLGFSTFETSKLADMVKSKKVEAKLGAFLSDPDAGRSFMLNLSCSRGITHSAVTRAFFSAAILYVACDAILHGKTWRPAFERNLLRLI